VRKLLLGQALSPALIAVIVLLTAGLFVRQFVLGGSGVLSDIRARGAWRVGMDPSFPPFENLDTTTGEVVGLDADLARAIGAKLGIRTEIISLGFDELLDATAAHQVDAAISALPIQPERTEDVRFSQPYVQAGLVLAAPNGSPLTGVADLGGRRVAVEWGSQGDAEARRLLADATHPFTLVPSETVDAALDSVVLGAADAALVDAISLALYRNTERLQVIGEPLVSDPYVVVVPADAPDLLRAVDEALRALESDGTLGAIRARWLKP
jgi:polar amino acid transport system substrate-binding protein